MSGVFTHCLGWKFYKQVCISRSDHLISPNLKLIWAWFCKPSFMREVSAVLWAVHLGPYTPLLTLAGVRTRPLCSIVYTNCTIVLSKWKLTSTTCRALWYDSAFHSPHFCISTVRKPPPALQDWEKLILRVVQDVCIWSHGLTLVWCGEFT